MGCQGSKGADATQQPSHKTLLSGDTSPRKAGDSSPNKAGAISPKRATLTLERDVPAEARIELPKHSTLGKVSCPSAFRIGQTVEVVEEFKAMLSDDCELPTTLKKGCLGVVCEIDVDGEAGIEFSVGNEIVQEWVDHADFPKLQLKAMEAGRTVEVLEEIQGISDQCVMLKEGWLGVVCEIDEDGDARIEFSKGGETFEEFVDQEDFPKLLMKAVDCPPKVIMSI
jgi:hypothetical protein